jgi:hypothetical protein
MEKIKIKDLAGGKKISRQELKRVKGGISLGISTFDFGWKKYDFGWKKYDYDYDYDYDYQGKTTA